jgi:hypothetical protein
MAEVILQSPNPSDDLQSLLAAHRRAWSRVGSPVKLKSVIEQLDFYEDTFSSGAPATDAKRTSIRALAKDLRNTLEANFLIARETDRDLTSTATPRSGAVNPDLAETEAAVTSEDGPR